MLFMKTNRASICRSFVPQCHAWNSFLFWQGVWIWRGFNIMSRRLKIKEKVMHLNEAGSVIYRCCLFPTNLCSKPVLVSITWCSAYRRRDNLSFSHWGRVMIITIRGATSKHEHEQAWGGRGRDILLRKKRQTDLWFGVVLYVFFWSTSQDSPAR